MHVDVIVTLVWKEYGSNLLLLFVSMVKLCQYLLFSSLQRDSLLALSRLDFPDRWNNVFEPVFPVFTCFSCLYCSRLCCDLDLSVNCWFESNDCRNFYLICGKLLISWRCGYIIVAAESYCHFCSHDSCMLKSLWVEESEIVLIKVDIKVLLRFEDRL